MNLLKNIYLREILSNELKFSIVFFSLLFFPNKSSLYYFLFIASLFTVFSIRDIYRQKNLALNIFTNSLIIINTFFIITSVFSKNIYNSVLLISDLIIISIFVAIFFVESLDMEKLFTMFLYLLTFFSIIKIINDFIAGGMLNIILYDNPIRIGIVSALGLIISLNNFVNSNKYIYLIIGFINLTAVYLSESKGVFIGLILITSIMFLQRRKKLLLSVLIIVLLTIIIPNPIKNMFSVSIYKDKYSMDRIKIWKMSFDMFADNPLFGIGPNNFKDFAPKYNFKQTKGPANYFKIPKQSHNDYLKILAENGIFGLVIILLIIFSLIRYFKKNKLIDIYGLLLLFLLFQSLFFNILFKPFFLFLFLFLFKILFNKNLKFINITNNFRLVTIFIILFTFLIGHLLPYLSAININKSKIKDIPFSERITYLNKAEFYMPISPYPLVNKAILNFSAFTKTFNFDYCFLALDEIKKAKRIAPTKSEILNLEIQFYTYYYKPLINLRKSAANYRSETNKIQGDILPLFNNAIENSPFNPFLRYRRVKLLLDFGLRNKAYSELKRILEIEPEYMDAILLLEREFHFYKNRDDYFNLIKRIKTKRKNLNPKIGTYLHRLYFESID